MRVEILILFTLSTIHAFIFSIGNKNRDGLTYCTEAKDPAILNGEIASPDWSVGYYVCGNYIVAGISSHKVCTDSVLWWDGWVGQKYCSDLHYHLTSTLDLKLNLTTWATGDGDTCQYP